VAMYQITTHMIIINNQHMDVKMWSTLGISERERKYVCQ